MAAVSRGGLLASLTVCVIVAGLVCFAFWKRQQQTDNRVEALLRRVDAVAAGQARLTEETNAVRAQARAAEERADKSEVMRAQAAKDAENAEAAKATAEQQAKHALQQAQTASQELQEVRKAREQELNRMQEALAKVAATRRTADGMIIDLGSDSFKFDFDKATLRPENREVLSRLAGILLASHGYRLHVYGYTDDVGTEEYNQGLSERRAAAVREYLAKSGVPSEIMTSKGFGKSSPRVKATTQQAREKNRRVEIGIVDTVIKYGGEPDQR
jgi:outer membrane protein OmpA-like peptidoglycan-associated protein